MSKPAKSPVSRLMAYVTRRHKAQFSFVVICILASAVASMVGTLFIQVIIDDYILKMLETGEDLFAGLVAVLTVMAAVYLVGALATLFYNRVIAIVGQKVLKEIRDDLFVRMQRLPISYFDSHNHGDIMSVYTNDIDTLRQFIAQSLPMMISSIVTLVFSFAVMLHFSLPLALIVLVISVLMVVVGRLMVRYSGKYFFKQQTSVGYVNGYSEEIFGGLKVVKVFNHEDACREQMRKLNEELYENSLKANGMATVMMGIMTVAQGQRHGDRHDAHHVRLRQPRVPDCRRGRRGHGALWRRDVHDHRRYAHILPEPHQAVFLLNNADGAADEQRGARRRRRWPHLRAYGRGAGDRRGICHACARKGERRRAHRGRERQHLDMEATRTTTAR